MAKSKDKLIRERDVLPEMCRIGVDPMGIKLMRHKSMFRIIRLTEIKVPLAMIIKENMLSAGGDAAVHKLTCAYKIKYTDVLLMGTVIQYEHLLSRLNMQPFGGKGVARRVKKLMAKG